MNVFTRLFNAARAFAGEPVGNKVGLHGRFHDLKLFNNQDEADRYHAGDMSIVPLWECDQPNGITNTGIHYLLEVGFRSDAMAPVAQIAPWFAGLIDDASFTAVAAADTPASHAGWIEAVAYTEADRQTLAFGAAAARAITAQVAFTMNATKTLRGIFVISDDTKSGTSGTLWSTALFGTPPTVVNGNVLTANYSLTD
jgi:hypothetical protein